MESAGLTEYALRRSDDAVDIRSPPQNGAPVPGGALRQGSAGAWSPGAPAPRVVVVEDWAEGADQRLLR